MLSLFYSHRKLQYELGKKKEIFFYEFDQYVNFYFNKRFGDVVPD